MKNDALNRQDNKLLHYDGLKLRNTDTKRSVTSQIWQCFKIEFLRQTYSLSTDSHGWSLNCTALLRKLILSKCKIERKRILMKLYTLLAGRIDFISMRKYLHVLTSTQESQGKNNTFQVNRRRKLEENENETSILFPPETSCHHLSRPLHLDQVPFGRHHQRQRIPPAHPTLPRKLLLQRERRAQGLELSFTAAPSPAPYWT